MKILKRDNSQNGILLQENLEKIRNRTFLSRASQFQNWIQLRKQCCTYTMCAKNHRCHRKRIEWTNFDIYCLHDNFSVVWDSQNITSLQKKKAFSCPSSKWEWHRIKLSEMQPWILENHCSFFNAIIFSCVLFCFTIHTREKCKVF